MRFYIDLLDSININNCEDRRQARDDLKYSFSMGSVIAIENINHCWVDIDQKVIENLSQQDAQYRAFLVEFWEKYRGRD